MSAERIDQIQTRWSVIRAAHAAASGDSAAAARQLLVLQYAPAIRRYVGAMLRDDDQADDLAQDVVVRLMQGDFVGADPGRGRFRDLLKTAVRNAIRSHWAKSRRRSTSAVDPEQADPRGDVAEDAEWTAIWQRTVLDRTWTRLQADDQAGPSTGVALLRLRVEQPEATSEQLAALHAERSGVALRADACRQALSRARARFAGHLLDEVRAGLDDESAERVQEELAALGLLEWMRTYLDRAEE